ncbi:hypothetical protein Taro_019696 [Colocasia esculenta]|uniref:Uncharacterized protein n=1 Tax=Colocasia esculenta TaxID=4460 RepID=A0A843UWZ0_COLES|nr:hypothetical protein [Colocasia esculenta]
MVIANDADEPKWAIEDMLEPQTLYRHVHFRDWSDWSGTAYSRRRGKATLCGGREGNRAREAYLPVEYGHCHLHNGLQIGVGSLLHAYERNPMLSAPTTKACTYLPPAFFCRVTQLVTMFASGLVVRSSSGGDFGLPLLAWPVSDT